ncbi:ribbon-helix-helix domain-containing protein [Rhizobium sp. FY34]|uniref:ribbon-helix-helix domain-containing protein n=1 Tax=Rhizobium sp. FY34 TaxID=2562309 RepID=UPI001FEE7FE6|nr:ribbon-helix-helix domain-containing protein [Rhizobium sp. FY34]
MADSDKTQLSFNISAKMATNLESASRVLGQNPDWIVQQALELYLQTHGNDIFQDAQGLDELDRGESIDLDMVLEKAQLIVDAAETRRRRAG